jgi:hypothetical protein
MESPAIESTQGQNIPEADPEDDDPYRGFIGLGFVPLTGGAGAGTPRDQQTSTWRTHHPRTQFSSYGAETDQADAARQCRDVIDDLLNHRRKLDHVFLVRRFKDAGLSMYMFRSSNVFVQERVYVKQALLRLRAATTASRHSKKCCADDAICSICLDEYRSNQAKCTLGCGHAFHKGCIDRWWSTSLQASCPLCKRDSMRPAYADALSDAAFEPDDGDHVVFQQDWFMGGGPA